MNIRIDQSLKKNQGNLNYTEDNNSSNKPTRASYGQQNTANSEKRRNTYIHEKKIKSIQIT